MSLALSIFRQFVTYLMWILCLLVSNKIVTTQSLPVEVLECIWIRTVSREL